MSRNIRLEIPFLKTVFLHLNSMKDVMEFESINKKCSNTIRLSEVNPWLYRGKYDGNKAAEIERFHKIFEVPTCNCDGKEIDESVLLKVKSIRNYLFKGTDKSKSIELIIPKVESFKTKENGSEEEFELLFKNMKFSLKIECGEKYFKGFELAFRKLNVFRDFYPEKIIIKMTCDVDIDHLINDLNKNRIHCIWGKYENDGVYIVPKVMNYIDFVNLKLLLKNENVKLMLKNKDFPVSLKAFANLEKRRKYLELIKKVCASTIYIKKEKEDEPIHIVEKVKLPNCVNKIVDDYYCRPDAILLYNRGLPFSFDGIEILHRSGHFEMGVMSDLKELVLRKANQIKVFKQCRIDKKEEWGMKNSIEFFPKLTKLELHECEDVKILNKIKNLEYLKLVECELCQINVDSKNLKKIILNCNKSKFKFKIYRNDIEFIISECISVDIEIECEEGIKPNIEITECQRLKMKSNNEMGNIIIEQSNNITFTEGLKCELFQLNYSEITTEGLIEAKVVILINVLKTCPINLNKAKEIYIGYMNNYIFGTKFENCKKLVISECINCKFDLGNNQIEEMKVLKCKSINIEGTLPNIKSFVTYGNNECKLPITNNITIDEEIIELKENIKIVTGKKHLIIRNGKDVKCEIESLIKSDITFENCQNIHLELENKFIGILEFNNWDSFLDNSRFGDHKIYIGCVDSLIINNSKNLNISPESINKSIKIKDSDLILDCYNGITVDNIEIENSNIEPFKNIVSNKCVIINSKINSKDNIIKNCKEELVLKGNDGSNFLINKQVKKITFEDCSKLQCFEDLKGREVKLIRCSDMELIDTSNSIQMDSCENIKINIQKYIINRRCITPRGGFVQPAFIQNGPLINQLSPSLNAQPIRVFNFPSYGVAQPTICQPQPFVNPIQPIRVFNFPSYRVAQPTIRRPQPFVNPIQPSSIYYNQYFTFFPKRLPTPIEIDSSRINQTPNESQRQFLTIIPQANQRRGTQNSFSGIPKTENPPK